MLIALLIMIGAGAGIGWLWWHQHQSRLPLGIASGNGRLESDEIDIDTKFAGRIAKLFVDERRHGGGRPGHRDDGIPAISKLP